MDLAYSIDRFSRNRAVFEGLVRGATEKQAKWKPEPEKWSILEVVNHLHDEEREDFRARLELVLKDPHSTWPAIDPQTWVVTRSYIDRDVDESLNNFLKEREASLSWLRQLTDPNWDNHQQRPDGTSLSAGDLLASWLAHDFLHIRQLARLHWQYIGSISIPYQTTYGGPWKES